MKIGIITMGHSPRPDLIAQFKINKNEHSIVEKGALDDLKREEITANGSIPVITRLNDGKPIEVDKEFLDKMVQKAVLTLEKENVESILVLCSTPFNSLKSKVPLFLPSKIIPALIASISNMPKKMDLVCPVKGQEKILKEKWEKKGFTPYVVVLPPWSPDNLAEITPILKSSPGEWVVLDCMGFTSMDAKKLSNKIGKMVFSSSTIFLNSVAGFF